MNDNDWLFTELGEDNSHKPETSLGAYMLGTFVILAGAAMLCALAAMFPIFALIVLLAAMVIAIVVHW